MEYCFDSIFIKDHVINMIGWATRDDRNNRMEIHVEGKNGEHTTCEITRACRPDVGLVKYQDTKAADVGIFLRIPYEDNNTSLKLVMQEIKEDGTIADQKKEYLNPTAIKARGIAKKTKKYLVDTKEDVKDTAKKILKRDNRIYDEWFRIMRATKDELIEQRHTKLSIQPFISIVVPLYHTPIAYLRTLIRSVLEQSYRNWELILVNASPEDEQLKKTVQVWCQYDKRIQCVTLEKNLGIAGNTNQGIGKASGEFVAFIDHDDYIEGDALFCYVKALNENNKLAIFYSDEDKVREHEEEFFYPHFKSDYNPDLLHANNYMCHFLMVKRELLMEIGGERSCFDGAQDYDLILRLVEKTDQIYHCPRILYHWRSHNASTAQSQGNKNYAMLAGMKALNEHYKRMGIEAEAEIGAVDGWYTTRYQLTKKPLVSILIPNKDHIDDLDKCLQSLMDRCSYENYEIIIIENNSTEPETFAYYKKIEAENEKIRTIYWEREFNYSAINNFGAAQANGEYLLLLNNDVEIITPDLIENMLGYGMRPEVGIVGAKLLYDDHTIQHAGVLVGAGGLADHIFKGCHEDDPCYMGRAIASQDLSAVTAACLLIRKSVYDEVGGLEEAFQVAFNDVDLCLKVRQAGYLVVYDADVKLYHYESKSRGSENTPERFVRFGNEMELLNRKWDILGSFKDPYYNPNLSYMEYYKLNHVKKDIRKAEIEKLQREKYGRKESDDSHSKLQWKKIFKRLSGIS